MSDSEQCSNRLDLDLSSILVNFSYELGKIMIRYDFLWAIRAILSNNNNNHLFCTIQYSSNNNTIQFNNTNQGCIYK